MAARCLSALRESAGERPPSGAPISGKPEIGMMEREVE